MSIASRGLKLAWEAMAGTPGSTAVLNAANEVAVQAFLDGQLRFDQIHRVNRATLEDYLPSKPAGLDDLLAIDAEARQRARALMGRIAV